MTNMKAAERAAELANAAGTVKWLPYEFAEANNGAQRAFVQFIADADAAAREVQNMAKECQFSLGTSMVGKISRTLSPFILPDDVDPLLIEARNLAVERNPRAADIVMAGGWDNGTVLQGIIDGLRRGMELAKEQGK